MQLSVPAAQPAPPVHEIHFLDGAREIHRADGDVWRYEPSDRLGEIVHPDGGATVFDPGGSTLYFNADGDLVWTFPAAREDRNA